MSRESASCCIRRARWFSCGLAALAVVVCSMGLVRSVRADEGDYPKAEVILEKYIKATGGKAAYEKIHNNVVKATFLIGMGAEAPMTIYTAEPNKSYSILESESMGTFERGFDGEVAWEKSTMQGARVVRGSEREFRVRQARFNSALHWRDLYKKAECVGVETVNGKECYKVVMTPDEGLPETSYYDKDTGLLLKTELTVETAMGDIPVEVFVSDYKQVGDLLVAHRYDQVMSMAKQSMMIQSIEHNVDMPADRFEPPDDIKALIKQEKEAAETAEDPEKASEA